ncbi:MAG: hypothetical protein E6I63_11025 [Chloroflexi bacterium]|nr:MAG: hypothetical protein E6I63_11025 [Chloroflexota bacterium]
MDEELQGWLRQRLPADWFVAVPELAAVGESAVVRGRLQDVAGAADPEAAAAGRIARFREESRAERQAIAREAETRHERLLSWEVSCGPVVEAFSDAWEGDPVYV